jgi:hypothetical protein
VLGRRPVDAVLLVGARPPDAAERDGLGRRSRRDRVGLLKEPADLRAPGLLARLALVREQMVVATDAVMVAAKGLCFSQRCWKRSARSRGEVSVTIPY